MIHEYVLNTPDGAKVGSLERHELPGRGHLARLWVHPDYRGQGYARTLLGRATADADREGTVLESNPWGFQDVNDEKADRALYGGAGIVSTFKPKRLQALFASVGFIPEHPDRVGYDLWIRQPQRDLSSVHAASVKIASADLPEGVHPEDHAKLQEELDYEYDPVLKDYLKEVPSTGRAHVLAPHTGGTWHHRVRLFDQDHRPVWFETGPLSLDDALFSTRMTSMDRTGKPMRGYTKMTASTAVKSYLPWADLQGLSPAQTAFQKTHPVVRRQILQGLLNAGRHQEYRALAGVHQAQNQVDRLRSYEGRPSPYTHPSRPQPWHTGSPTDQTQMMPVVRPRKQIGAAVEEGDTQHGLGRGHTAPASGPTMDDPEDAGLPDVSERTPLGKTWWEVEREDRQQRRSSAPALRIENYGGIEGNNSHITRNEYGSVPLSWISRLRGGAGERPDEHRNYQGQDWEDFKAHVAAGTPGYSDSIFIVVKHGEEPRIYEGNHRRDAYKENALASGQLMADAHVPVEVRYFGHAEKQGDLGERAMRRTAMPRDDSFLQGLTYEYTAPHQQVRDSGQSAEGHEINAYSADGTHVGHLSWGPIGETINYVQVHPEYRRMGLANELFDRAWEHSVDNGIGPPDHDWENLSEDAKSWIIGRGEQPDENSPFHGDFNRTAAVDESGLKAAGIAVIALDTGRVLMQQRALNPLMCPCGMGVTWDEQNGYQHDDGSVDHDGDFYGSTVSDLLDSGHPEEEDSEGPEGLDKTAALDFDPNEGTWEFPGGKLDPGELARAAAVREFREEVGQDLPPGVFVGAWVSPGGLVVAAGSAEDRLRQANTEPILTTADPRALDLEEEYGLDGVCPTPGRGGDPELQRVATDWRDVSTEQRKLIQQELEREHPTRQYEINPNYPQGYVSWRDFGFPITKSDEENGLDQPMVGFRDNNVPDDVEESTKGWSFGTFNPACSTCYNYDGRVVNRSDHGGSLHSFVPLLPEPGERRFAAAKTPVYKGFIYLIQRERDIDLSQREIANPDDPDGDMTEQSAWWDIEHAKKNPALRKECKTGTPWDELELWADKSVRSNKEIKESLARLASVQHESSLLDEYPELAAEYYNNLYDEEPESEEYEQGELFPEPRHTYDHDSGRPLSDEAKRSFEFQKARTESSVAQFKQAHKDNPSAAPDHVARDMQLKLLGPEWKYTKGKGGYFKSAVKNVDGVSHHVTVVDPIWRGGPNNHEAVYHHQMIYPTGETAARYIGDINHVFDAVEGKHRTPDDSELWPKDSGGWGGQPRTRAPFQTDEYLGGRRAYRADRRAGLLENDKFNPEKHTSFPDAAGWDKRKSPQWTILHDSLYHPPGTGGPKGFSAGSISGRVLANGDYEWKHYDLPIARATKDPKTGNRSVVVASEGRDWAGTGGWGPSTRSVTFDIYSKLKQGGHHVKWDDDVLPDSKAEREFDKAGFKLDGGDFVRTGEGNRGNLIHHRIYPLGGVAGGQYGVETYVNGIRKNVRSRIVGQTINTAHDAIKEANRRHRKYGADQTPAQQAAQKWLDENPEEFTYWHTSPDASVGRFNTETGGELTPDLVHEEYERQRNALLGQHGFRYVEGNTPTQRGFYYRDSPSTPGMGQRLTEPSGWTPYWQIHQGPARSFGHSDYAVGMHENLEDALLNADHQDTRLTREGAKKHPEAGLVDRALYRLQHPTDAPGKELGGMLSAEEARRADLQQVIKAYGLDPNTSHQELGEHIRFVATLGREGTPAGKMGRPATGSPEDFYLKILDSMKNGGGGRLGKTSARPPLPSGLVYVDDEKNPWHVQKDDDSETAFWRYRDAELVPPLNDNDGAVHLRGQNESHGRSVDWQPMMQVKPQSDFGEDTGRRFDDSLATTRVWWNDPICETCYLRDGYTVPADSHGVQVPATSWSWAARESQPEPHEFKPMHPEVDAKGNFKEAAAGKCSYCKSTATKQIKHSEGMGLISVCDKHLSKGKTDAENCTPDGTRDPSNIDWIHDASVRVGMPLTQEEPGIHGLEGSGEGALNRKVTLTSGEWMAKSPHYKHLQEYKDPEDVEYFKNRASEDADMEEFASRFGRALSDPSDESIVPEAVRGNKKSDPGPTVYIRRYPEYRDMDYGWLDYDDLEHHTNSPRGKVMGYFHSVLADGDHIDHHNMLLLGNPMEDSSEKIQHMPIVSIDHTHSSLPEYAKALAGDDQDHVRRMTWHHQGQLSPYAEQHFLAYVANQPGRKMRNPLAPGDTERALAASETLRPWAQSRGREDWLDAAQHRMRLLGRRATGTETMFPYQMPHEQQGFQATAATQSPVQAVFPAIRDLVVAGKPDFIIRTAEEVAREHHDKIIDTHRPTYHEEYGAGPGTGKVYAHRAGSHKSTVFLVPLRHIATGQTGWVRGRTDQQPHEWQLYRDSEIADAAAGRKPDRLVKSRRTRPLRGEDRARSPYGDLAAERYTRGFARGTPGEGDVPLDEEGHQIVEPRPDYVDDPEWAKLLDDPELVEKHASVPWWSCVTS